MLVEIGPIAKGISRPVVQWARRRVVSWPWASQHKGYWGKTKNAKYFYSVWRKHFTLLRAAGLPQVPAAVAEFGPGDSLGSGLTALLMGVDRYAAFDVANFTEGTRDAELLGELRNLVEADAPWHTATWPALDATLKHPQWQWTTASLGAPRQRSQALDSRQEQLARALQQIGKIGSRIDIYAPWGAHELPAEVFDVVFSHSALQYVADLRTVFRTMENILKPGGFMSHQIDLTSIGLTKQWDGHRLYGDRLWDIVNLGNPYRLNRLQLHAYLEAIQATETLRIVRIFAHEAKSRSAETSRAQPSLAAAGLSFDHAVILLRKE